MRKLLPAFPMKNGIYSSTSRPADNFTADQATVVHSYQPNTLQITRGDSKSKRCYFDVEDFDDMVGTGAG